MSEHRLNIPEPGVRAVAHDMAYRIAREKLAAVTDVEAQCRQSGAAFDSARRVISLIHLGRDYEIAFPGGEVTLAGSGETVPVRDKILILHYFLRARGTPLSGNPITYKELPDGLNYWPTFFKRAIEPVVNNFKDRPEKLPEAAARLAGKKTSFGDIAVTIPAFPRVPLTFVLWLGDGEFTADGSIMFDSTISDYLPTEDITILSEMIAWKLVRLL